METVTLTYKRPPDRVNHFQQQLLIWTTMLLSRLSGLSRPHPSFKRVKRF